MSNILVGLVEHDDLKGPLKSSGPLVMWSSARARAVATHNVGQDRGPSKAHRQLPAALAARRRPAATRTPPLSRP